MVRVPMLQARACAAALGALLALAGCRRADPGGYFGSTDRRGKDASTFYVNNGDEPEYLDPTLATDSTSTTLVNDLFEGLVILHPEDMRPTQGVAERYEQSADNRIYRFHLRPEARWSDGQPVVADDFVYAWRRALDASVGARNVTMLYVLKNAKPYHQGRLKVLGRSEVLRPRPEEDAAGVLLAEGSAVMVLATSPATAAIEPLPSPGAAALIYEAGAASATLTTKGDGGASLSRRLPDAVPLRVVGLGPQVTCNDSPDHWYRVRLGDGDGYLPGCALSQADLTQARADKPGQGPAWALVRRHADLPRFRPSQGVEDAADEPQIGFLPASALRSDPSVVGVRAAGDHLLEVELAEPTPYFLELCGYATFFPVRRDVIERFEAMGEPDKWYRPENIVSNGPYTLESHRFRYEITFRRNPHHYDHDRLKIHRIVWLAVADYNATMNLYETAEIDYIGQNISLPAAHMDRLSQFRDFHRSTWLSTYWYEFNVERKPVDDVRVRHALDLATDKQQLIDRITRAGQQPATHYVPDFMGSGYAQAAAADRQAGRDPFSGPGHDFDPQRARALLGEAGYPVAQVDGRWHAAGFPSLELLYNTGEGHQKIAVAVQDMWQRHLGISVQLRNEEWKVMLKSLRDGHFQVARFGWVADYNHPHTYMDVFLSYSSNNHTRWGEPRFDQLVEEAAATADQRASIQLYRRAEELAVSQMPRIPLYFYTKSTLIKPWVKGFYPNVGNRHAVRWMWIDPSWRASKDNPPSYPPRELPPPEIIH